MSVQLTGVLTVVERTGTYGRFCVGNLQTEIGEFSVKDGFLDQFSPGKYPGRFLIARIFPYSFTYHNRLGVEVRAKILEFVLDSQQIEEGHAELPPTPDLDPILEQETPARSSVAESSDGENLATPATSGPANHTATTSSVAPDAIPRDQDTSDHLFDEALRLLIQSKLPVALDPTVDRQLLRQQIHALKKQFGYEWNAVGQNWLYAGHS